jgi:alcohol dehydrogenase class IV
MVPTRIVYGRGRLGELGALARPFGTSALVVCGRHAMQRTGVLDRATSSLEAAGVRAHVHSDVSANPRSDEVDRAVELARREGCELVVGLGGGSAVDAAKAAAVGVGHESVREIIGTTLEPSDAALPVVAVPTTAGTGSEVSKGSIVIDVVREFKSGIRGDDVFPKVALVDPELPATMPHEVAVETGFDALTHAIESYVARRANPLTDVLAERSIGILGRRLRELAAGGRNGDGRVFDDLCLAALIGGLNVATASTCLPHRLQQAMGSTMRVEAPHARGLAIVYPAWLRAAYPYASERFDRVAELLDGGGDVHEAVGSLLDDTGMRARLRDYGYRREEIDDFVGNVSGNVENDPIDGADERLMRAIYEEAW